MSRWSLIALLVVFGCFPLVGCGGPQAPTQEQIQDEEAELEASYEDGGYGEAMQNAGR